MATLYQKQRKRAQKIQSGSRFLEVAGLSTPAIPLPLQSEDVEAGWPALLNAEGKVTADSSNKAIFGMLGPIYQRFKDENGQVWQPVLLRGLAYTHKEGLVNAGDISGNLFCLGSNGEQVDPGGVGTNKNSRVVIIGKRFYK